MALFDLGTLRAKITADKTDFDNKLNSVQTETQTLGSKISETLSKGAGVAIKGLGVAMAGLAVTAGASAIKLGKEVIQQFGELEQNLGGSEAVFGKYAESIQKSGEEAYKNLGVSQSQYLSTANKMGALFQGSGIEQQKSLELTEKAMQRAADMASVMGIDMQQALDAVTGAAKGNFTMMDNLGVSMNATNIEAYALSKGMKDFSYATATQAEKADIAMKMFFENTEQYSGNFAKESTQTISGSLGLLQASLSSFTAGLGNADADMTNLTENMVDAFKSVVKNIVPVLKNIVRAIPQATDAIIKAIAEILPMLLETVTGLFTQVLETLLSLLPSLIPAAVGAVMTIVNTLIENLPLIISAAIQLVISLVQGITQSIPTLIPIIVDAVILIAETLIDNIDMLVDAGIKILLGLTKGIIDALPKLIEKAPVLIQKLVTAIVNNLPLLIEAGIQIIIMLGKALIDNVPTLLAKIPEILNSLVNGFKNLGSKVWDIGKNLVQGIWQGIQNAGGWLKDKLKGFVDGALNSIKDFFGIHSPSEKTANFGKFLVEGLANGVTKNAKLALSSIDELNQSAMNRLQDLSFNGAVNINAINQGVQGYRASQAVSASSSPVNNISFTVNQQNKVDSKFDADNMGDNLNRFFKQKLIAQGIKV